MKLIYIFQVTLSLTAILSCSSLPKKQNPTFKGCNFTFNTIRLENEKKIKTYLYAADSKIKVFPAVYQDLSYVSEDWIRAKKDDKYGFIDVNSRPVFRFELSLVGDFFDGFAIYRLGEHHRDPKGFLDKNGNLLGDVEYENAFRFQDGYAIVQNNGKQGIINTKGKLILPIKYDFLSNIHDGWAIFKRDEHQGLVNIQGIEKKFTHENYDIRNYFYHGTIQFYHYKKLGLMDSNFKVIIPPKYDYMGIPQEGLVRFELNKKWGFLDLSGNVIIEPKFDTVYDFSEGYATISINDKYGIINKQGGYLIEPKLKSIASFSNGIAVAKEGEKEGYITTDAEWLIPPIFEKLGTLKDGIFTYQLNEAWGVVNFRECLN
ncbi:WG repeat-containing protein [Leptospira perdikensis]|uniref:WG repeat-containing protein n=1 Tax=Leptospira perdikensis TaxID=2484948 RepID=A0A4R9JL47_9LEPT|nr:WG repeat-containing protein [Leptospira perdikensis]TGL44632.1 WG repeat-containing protein [Leptospira perdikensis]